MDNLDMADLAIAALNSTPAAPTPTKSTPVCWRNGQIVPLEQATVSIFDHGLLYGDGVFEGIRFYNVRAFRLQAHLERLFLSARAIALGIPYSIEQLTQAVIDTIAAAPDQWLFTFSRHTRPRPLGN